MPSRIVHRVRCTDPNNNQNWVEIKVIDKVNLIGPNGIENMYDFSKPTPFIKDTTGSGSATGSGNNCSRVSHMEALSYTGNDGQSLDIEILDVVTHIGPNSQEDCFFMPSVDAVDGSSRTTERKTITNSSNSAQVLLIERVNDISFIGPNGIENLISSPGDDTNELDTTVLVSDGQGGMIPPENTDPNVYIKWPANSQGPWLGADTPVKQGFLWWIVAANGGGFEVCAIFMVSMVMGSFGQSTGDFRIFIDNANFPVFGDGTIIHYPFYSAIAAPRTAFPDNVAQSYPDSPAIPNDPPNRDPGNPAISAGTGLGLMNGTGAEIEAFQAKQKIDADLDPSPIEAVNPNGTPFQQYLAAYENWCFTPWVAPPPFGFGCTNAFVLNLTRIRKNHFPSSPDDQNITFTIKCSGTPDLTTIAEWQTSFLDTEIGCLVNLQGTEPEGSPPGPIKTSFITDLYPVNYTDIGDSPDPVNFELAAGGAYFVGITPPFDFFGDKNRAFIAPSAPNVDIVPNGVSGATVDLQQISLYNSFTNTGNHFNDPGFGFVCNVTITPNDIVSFSGTFESNENNFQLFVF